jgi:hypothetical protein
MYLVLHDFDSQTIPKQCIIHCWLGLSTEFLCDFGIQIVFRGHIGPPELPRFPSSLDLPDDKLKVVVNHLAPIPEALHKRVDCFSGMP